MSGINLAADEKSIWTIVQAILQLAQGRSNAVGQVTLRANQTTTTVTKATDQAAVNVAIGSEIFLSPRTANAAAALTNVYVSSVLQGSFVLTHSSTATLDRTFGWRADG